MESFEQMHGLICELMDKGCGKDGLPNDRGMRILQELAEYCGKTRAWHAVRKHARRDFAKAGWRELFIAYKGDAWRVADKMELGKVTCAVVPLIWEKMLKERENGGKEND